MTSYKLSHFHSFTRWAAPAALFLSLVACGETEKQNSGAEELATKSRTAAASTASTMQSDIQLKGEITLAELDAMELPMGKWEDDRGILWVVHSAKHYSMHCPNFDIDGNGRIELIEEKDASGKTVDKGDYGILSKAMNSIRTAQGWPDGLDLLEGPNATRTLPWKERYQSFNRGIFYYDYFNCLGSKSNPMNFDVDGASGGGVTIADMALIYDAFKMRPHAVTAKTKQQRIAQERLRDNMNICYAYFKLNDEPKPRVVQQNCGIAPKTALRRLPDLTVVKTIKNNRALCTYSSGGKSRLQRYHKNPNASEAVCGDGKGE